MIYVPVHAFYASRPCYAPLNHAGNEMKRNRKKYNYNCPIIGAKISRQCLFLVI